MKDKGAEFDKYIDVAKTLMSRDYKGFPTYGMNGVIEVWKLNKENV